MSEHEWDMEEMRTVLYKAVFERMAEKIEERVPANGKFMKVSQAMRDPADKKICLLSVDYDQEYPGEKRWLSMGCIFPGTDAVCSNFVFNGTKAELLEWLKAPASIEEARKIYHNLRSRCDNDI